MPNVLLLRAPTHGAADKYESTFLESGSSVFSIPVLETVLTNLDKLERTIRLGPDLQNLRGVVVTSARACEAWKVVVQSITESVDKTSADWSAVPFYAVGKATSAALSDLGRSLASPSLMPNDIRGDDSGTSEQLAHFLVHDIEERPAKLLYLTGDKNRDTLSNIVTAASLQLTALKVYETQGSSSFAAELECFIINKKEDITPWWIVFFAPSAANFVTPVLRRHFNLPETENRVHSPLTRRHARIAAIGPTTSSFLCDTLGLEVQVTSPKPTADDLVSAILEYDQAHSFYDTT